MVFRTNAAAPFAKGRAALLRAACGTIGGRQRLTNRVQKSLITEWVDVVVEGGPGTAANSNSPACQAVNAALPG